MIKKITVLTFFVFLFSCGGVDFVLQDSEDNKFKNNTLIVFSGDNEEGFLEELYSFYGNNNNGEFILKTSLVVKKENRLVKQNQVAEKIDYELTAGYEIFSKKQNCDFYRRVVVSKFSFVPKSFGYNFGTDKSLEKLYKRSLRANIQSFSNSTPSAIVCL